MDMVIKWKKTYIPHGVFENIQSFNEMQSVVDKAVAEFGSAISINIFENHKWIASLRIIR